jgi:hypothetical protein
MRPRPDLIGSTSPPALEVAQLTTGSDLPSCHVYMEAQVFTPDSRFLVLHQSAHPHGSDPHDPGHVYLLCDLHDRGKLAPLTAGAGATAPSVSPDGRWMYYFRDATFPGGGRLSLERVSLDGSTRDTVMVIDGVVPGTSFRPSRPYPLSTISADGQRLAIAVFLGDGVTPDAPWGLLVFDLQRSAVALVLEGQTWCNLHAQYCRALAGPATHDILVQENHGNHCDPSGQFDRLVGGVGADIHVIRDDGSGRRDLPWGRDGNEHCQGHQCWIGRSTRALTSTSTRQPRSARLIAGDPISHRGHLGATVDAGRRADLTDQVEEPDFYHFATDASGRRLITDSGPVGQGGGLWLARLPAGADAPLFDLTFLLSPRSSWVKGAHIHPFLSPDGRCGFFNSDESGLLEAYLVRGWD